MRPPKGTLLLASVALSAVGAVTLRFATHPPILRTAHAQTAPVRNEKAEVLYERTRYAAEKSGLAIGGEVMVTRWHLGTTQVDRSVFTFQDDGKGRYRFVYSAPARARGRIVLCDGKQVYQYEPQRNTVLKSSLAAFNDNENTELKRPVAHWAVIEPGSPTLNNRPTQLLALRDTNGRLYSRRWIDKQTGRSLRTEYFHLPTGKLLQRNEVRQFRLLKTIPAETFTARFPATAQIVKLNNLLPPQSIRDEAKRLGLPLTIGNYSLRSLVRPPENATATTHFIYSDTTHTVSAFVSPWSGSGSPQTSKQSGTISLAPGLIAYTHTDSRNRSAVAWSYLGKRFVLMSRQPLPSLVALARHFAQTTR